MENKHRIIWFHLSGLGFGLKGGGGILQSVFAWMAFEHALISECKTLSSNT